MKDLEEKLSLSNARIKMIVTDGVFSMDGDMAKLDELAVLAEKYNALLTVDDCHATGFIGENGKGTHEYFGVKDKVDIITTTFGKALGGAMGGSISGPKEIIQLLRQKARPYLFSNALMPAIVAGTIRALDLVQEANDSKLAQSFSKKLFEYGVYAVGFFFPVVPKDQARIRTQISSSHTKEQLQEALEIFKKVKTELAV